MPISKILKPPAQRNLQTAVDLAVGRLQTQSHEQLEWLGAEPLEDKWRLTILDDTLEINPGDGEVHTSSGMSVTPQWRLLVLHYLGILTRPANSEPKITFGDLPDGRAYLSVYRARVNRYLCATVGKDIDCLRAAAGKLGAKFTTGGDLAFELRVFPRASVKFIWYAADDEFEPSVSLLLGENIESLFCTEDIVVMSQCLVSRLSGKDF